MTDIIKTVGYGIVAKNVRISVFMSPKRYMEMVNEAREYKINAKSDSEVVNRILDIFIDDLPIINLERDRLKGAIAQKNNTIMQLQQEINDFKVKKVKA